MTPITVTSPLSLPLTFAYLTSQNRQPLYVGNLVKFRFQVRDENDVARSLTGATIIMTVSANGVTSITRKTGVTSTGASAAQIVIDADQSAETTDPVTLEQSGKGWFTIRFDAVAADIAFLTSFINKRSTYDVSVKFGDSITQVTLVAGDIEILAPKTTFPIT